MAARQGLTLMKSRRRDRHALDYGGYMLTESVTNTVVAGGRPIAYSLTLDEAESWLSDPQSR